MGCQNKRLSMMALPHRLASGWQATAGLTLEASLGLVHLRHEGARGEGLTTMIKRMLYGRARVGARACALQRCGVVRRRVAAAGSGPRHQRRRDVADLGLDALRRQPHNQRQRWSLLLTADTPANTAIL